jgi:competence ComEA-like helix-hairpin-helix protein
MMRSSYVLLLPLLLTAGSMSLHAADENDLPEGQGKETVVKMCSNCHPLKQVTKKRFTKDYWSSVVEDMVSRGAEGTEDEALEAAAYLWKHYGKPVNINQATAKELQSQLGFTAADADLVIKHRTDSGQFKSLDDLLKVKGLNIKLVEENKKNISFQ